MDFNAEFALTIDANVPVVQVCTYEWERLRKYCIDAAARGGKRFFVWDCLKGRKEWHPAEGKEGKYGLPDENVDSGEIIDWFADENQKELVLLLEDFHPQLEDHLILRRLRECVRIKPGLRKTLVVQTLSFSTVKDLEKEVPILELPLPGKEDLGKILKFAIDKLPYDNKPRDMSPTFDEIVDASIGLSSSEAEWTYRKIIADKGRLLETEIGQIVEAKEAVIKKSGILEYFHPESSLNNIGGLENLKEWLKNRGKAFSQDAKKYGLPTPKGLLMLGIPGCGKSLTAKTIANEWNFPLLKFDLGKVFAGIVGESESNIRKALSLAETIAPSILWIDEIEKGLSGLGGNGDSGTSSRVFGTLLTWMQEKKAEVFVIATANDIEKLPPELLRKGRFDEIFFVDLPSESEREEIFKIHIERMDREVGKFDLTALAKKSIGFSGAEIEEAVKEALFAAYGKDREPEQEDVERAIQGTWPLSRTMQESISKLRKWAAARAKLASAPNTEEVKPADGVPQLAQERRNIFA
ncbi:MAG: AAA family ATPase [Fibrobacterales bacterium]|nr:AAA family ATPase [Fibrobacterales bacterium]